MNVVASDLIKLIRGFTVDQVVPASVTVSGAGTTSANGSYSIYTGSLTYLTPKANTTVFKKGSFYLYQNTNNQWRIDKDSDENNNYYSNTATTDLPPTSGWEEGDEGEAEAPTLSVVHERTTLFTDDTILESINFAKHEFFGLRPDVFITDVSDVSEPDDLTTTTDTLTMESWGITPLCYKASSILLSQKSKDEFYRRAADEMLKKFNGSI